MSVTRKEFLSSVVGVAAGAAGAALLVACGDSGGSTDAAMTGNCTMNGTSPPAIAGNHGHVLMVSKADISAGLAKTYDIRGTADHTHSVTLSATNFGGLTNNTTVMTNSTGAAGDGHTHSITIMCA